MSKRSSAQMKHGVPVEPVPMVDAQGRPVTSVEVAKSKPFARACIALMNKADGVPGKHDPKIGWKGFWVPTALLDEARRMVEEEARLRAEERGAGL